ncbi:MAG: beta strand repeat-containing protein [Paludibacter sp.]
MNISATYKLLKPTKIFFAAVFVFLMTGVGSVSGTNLYSYQTGNWNDANTWTTDPGGTTLTGSAVPGNNDVLRILPGRTVTLTGNVTQTGLSITIDAGSILDLTNFQFTQPLSSLSGLGTLKLASSVFPTVTTNTFVNTGGGTVEYDTGITLPVAQTTYNNLTINTSGTVIQVNNLSLNGNLLVKQGAFQINDASATRRQLTVNGNVTVNSGASMTVGTGNTTTTTNPIGITTTVAGPFINYYDGQSHRVVVMGDFINNGTVRLTNQTYPVYNAFPITGMATIYFRGSTDNALTCNGTTDFYNLVVDKGSDNTFILTMTSTQYNYFRLFGANTAPGDALMTATSANPNIKKALWLRNGTLDLKGLVVIPSLTEGATSAWPSSDFIIPSNAALVVDGTEVIVLATADDYGEVNTAYGVSGGTGLLNGITKGGNSGIAVLGQLQINNGYLSTRESNGLTYWSYASGQFIMNNGTLDTKQIDDASGSNLSKFSYFQNGGTVNLRGRLQHNLAYASISDLVNTNLNTVRVANGIKPTDGAFHLNTNSGSGFAMGAGTISIYDVCGATAPTYAFYANCPIENINVTGGTVQIIPTTGSSLADANYLINSTASFGNLIVNKASGSSLVQLNTNPLNVLQNISIRSGTFDANNLNVTVGGDFSIANGTTYTPGTNTTILNGTAAQTFTVNLAAPLSLNNLTLNKPVGIVVNMAGSQKVINIIGNFNLTAGTLNDNGDVLNVAGNVYNSGLYSGTGKMSLNSSTTQTIDGNGVFQNLELNNTTSGNSAPVSLIANTTVNGVLNLVSSKIFNIDTYKLVIGASGSIFATAFSNSCYIHTSGKSGDGGVTKTYLSNTAFTFPVGCFSTKRAATYAYTPASIGFSSSPTTYGSVTVIPVGYEHPSTTVNAKSLTFYWHVKSSGITGFASKVTHTFVYSPTDINGIIGNYIPSVYNSYTWNNGLHANVATGTYTLSDWTTPTNSTNYLDGDYTAGDGAFGIPKVFYSLASGLWSANSTWTFNSNHSGTQAGSVPGVNDIVVIGNNNTITLTNGTYGLNTASVSCASLQIDAGATLDIENNSSSIFSTVVNSPNGNGLFRLTTTAASTSTNNDISTFIFPSGDFTDFNVNKGTTEFYTTTGDGSSLYILPSIGYVGNMIFSPTGTTTAGDNMVFPNSSLTIYGDLTLNGKSYASAIGLSWNTNNIYYNNSNFYTTVEKTVHVYGNMSVNGGTFTFYDDNKPQHLIVDKDVNISSSNGANIIVWDRSYGYTPYFDGAALTNTFAIGGNLNNSGVNNGVFNGVKLNVGTHYVDVTFQGSTNASISGTGNTIFRNVTVNKGSNQETTLTCNIGGTLTTPADNWLTLQNGTFQYSRTNPAAGANFTISTGTPFTIPATAGLTVNMPGNTNNVNVLIANSAVNTNDFYLNGKLTVVNGNVYVGPTNAPTNNNDIEYSSGGTSAIEVNGGGMLVVNGAIRRNPTNAAGVLSYVQTGGAVTINGQKPITTNAKLEVLNTGSVFNMSGGTITIVRGGGGSTFGDLYLRPAASSVTGGTINFTQGSIDVVQSYLLDANVPLYNLTITGKTTATARNAKVNLMVSPLVLNGNLTLNNANSILNAVNGSNNINLTINGNLINNGTYIYGTNNTTFNGGVQIISGSSITNFYDLLVNPVTSLTMSTSLTVNHNLTLSGGQLLNGTNTINLKGDILNNATYVGDATTGGVVLNGSSGHQHIAGTGTFGRLELNNVAGAVLYNDITLQQNLKLTTGILSLNQYLLTLGISSTVEGSFSATKMITTDGVFSNLGIRKYFNTGASTFIFPLGSGGKYTPATLTVTANGSVSSVRLNNINTHSFAILDVGNVLQYYWDVESSSLSGFAGNILMQYMASDVAGASESSYVAAELLSTGTDWSKAATGSTTDNVDETNHTITFNFTAETSTLTGQYTAGIDPAIPNTVPQFISNKTGYWNDNNIWSKTNGSTYDCPAGGPNGFIVTIRPGDVVTTNVSSCSSYQTTINGTLRVVSPTINHNLGTVYGNGTLVVESGGLPAGKYGSFFDCSTGGTLEFGGTGNYTIIAGYLFASLPKLYFTGSGTRVLPDNDITICTQLKIDGPTVDNSVNNRKLTILGTMERYNAGIFTCGSGSGATVSFAGSSAQTVGGALGDFSGTNGFNNLEVNNTSGLTLNGATEVKGNLLLTAGNITTTSTNTLTISNTIIDCVTPVGGGTASFVNGPLTKTIIQGDNFIFPVGKGTNLGNLLTLSATQPGTQNWTVEYFNPSSKTTFVAPLTGVNTKEYWNVASDPNKLATVNIKWTPSSDLTPLMTLNGLSDMQVAQHDGTNWTQLESSATGDNYNGSAQTTSKILIPATGNYNYTLACTNTPKPKVKLSPPGPVCGTSGIPVTLSTSFTIYSPYSISYTKGGVAQTPLTPVSFPTTMPTDAIGAIYQITGFTYNGGTVGVFDATAVTAYAVPTTANAGPDQSLCGATSATLAGNTPTSGTGQWSIVSGAGGTVTNPTSPTSTFTGTNGSTYTLRWTISNGTCTSSDDVVIIFPLLAARPSAFTTFTTSVCQGATGVVYTVPNDPTVTTYNWSYTGGSGATITGTTNSVTVNYSNTATSGNLNVTANNNCNIISSPRTIAITVSPNIWVGTNGTDWNTAANWQAVMIPPSGADIAFAPTPANDLILDHDRTIGNLVNTSSQRLFIPAGVCLTVNGTINSTNDNNIYIQSSTTLANGSLIFPNASNVHATVEMYSKAHSVPTAVEYPIGSGNTYRFSWQFFGIPVEDIPASTTFDGSYVRKLNEADPIVSTHWIQLANADIVKPFIGYEITQDVSTGKLIVFQGKLVNRGFISDILIKTPANTAFGGQYVFANPYTAAIDIQKFISRLGSDTDGSVYLYSTGSYIDWGTNSGQGTSAGQYQVVTSATAPGSGIPTQIPSMQAVLVQMNTGNQPGSTVTFNYSDIVKNSELERTKKIVDGSSSSNLVYTMINVSGLTFNDRMWIFTDSTFTKKYDRGWDGYKMFGIAIAPQLYAIESDGNYQIDCTNNLDNTLLGFQAGQDIEDTLTFTHQNLEKRYAGVYLIDLVENKTVDITVSGTQYAFMAESTPAPVKRFRIVTRPYEKDASDAESLVKIFSSQSSIFVQNLADVNGECRVYDIAGHYLMKVSFVANAVTAISNSLIPGVYIATAIAGGEKVSKRLIVR